MLRSKEAKRNPWLSGARRIIAFTLLIGAAVAVSAVRGPTGTVQAEPPKPSQTEAPAPFDLSMVEENALGVLAFRPAAVFADPRMKAAADLANQMVSLSMTVLGLRPEVAPKVEEIEQVIGSWVHLKNEGAPQGQRNSLTAGLAMVRTIRPFDWKRAFRAVADGEKVELQEVPHNGKVYWKLTGTKHPLLREMCFYLPDDRTLVLEREANLRKVIDRTKTGTPRLPWAESWKQVDRGWFAAALHTANEEFRRSVAEAQDDDVALARLFVMNARSIVFGIEGMDHVVCRATAACESDAKAKEVANTAQASFTLARNALEALGQKKDLPHPQGAGVQFAKELLKTAEVGTRRDGETRLVDVRFGGKVDLAKFLADFVKAEMGVEEEKK